MDPLQQEFFFVPIPVAADLIPPLYDEATREIGDPEPEWQFVDEFGWLYVRAPQTLRVTNLGPVTATASVHNMFAAVTASVTATPRGLVFSSSAPDTADVTCTLDQLRLPYDPESTRGCDVVFTHSSAISASGEFEYTLAVTWDIVADPAQPGLDTPREFEFSDSIAVAEMQAVVTCQGANC